MAAKARINFRGHPNITATHEKTLEITRHEFLTRAGDCIIGVSADKGCADLDDELKKILQQEGSRLVATIVVGGDSYTIRAFGSSRLQMTHPHDIVIRKTGFTNCTRTIAIRSDAAAADLPRAMIRNLQSGALGYMVLEAFPP
jgi:hypothetical protein